MVAAQVRPPRWLGAARVGRFSDPDERFYGFRKNRNPKHHDPVANRLDEGFAPLNQTVANLD
jgi:hypothetical protein